MENGIQDKEINFAEYNQMVYNAFADSIITCQYELKQKILKSMMDWYQRTWEDEAKKVCLSKKFKELILISNEIKRICETSDINKLKLTYYDSNYEEFLRTSEDIFDVAKKAVDSQRIVMEEKKYQEYLQKIDDYELKISSVFKEEYKLYRSECLLDLEYLRSNGAKRYYSFRLSNYINENSWKIINNKK